MSGSNDEIARKIGAQICQSRTRQPVTALSLDDRHALMRSGAMRSVLSGLSLWLSALALKIACIPMMTRYSSSSFAGTYCCAHLHKALLKQAKNPEKSSQYGQALQAMSH